ncbi:MAG: hypothetical protein KF819_35240 [Labilithrix sp.]|nr:hypothetical protein [Labilithrix sp.]
MTAHLFEKTRIAAALIGLLAFLLGAPGRAAPPAGGPRTSALSWVRLPGADACIAAPALAAAVEARLGRRVFVPPSDAELSVEGTIGYDAKSKRYHATFRVADRDGKVLGTREVDERADACDKLDDRLAFVLSILIDPDAALDPAPARPPDPAPAPAPPPPTAPPAPREEPPPAPPEPWRWLAGADFGGAAGLVPDVGWVVSGHGILTPPKWPGLRAKGSSFLPTSRRVEGIARADITLVTGELAICPVQVRSRPFGFNACLGGMLGQLGARGGGFPDSRGYDTLLGGIVVDTLVELAVTRSPDLVFTLSPALVVPLSRARLAYDDAGGVRRTIFEVSPVGGSLSLGLAIGAR